MKSKTNLKNLLAVLAISTVASLALGQDSQSVSSAGATQTTSANISDTAAKAPSKLEMTYFGIYVGPSVTNTGESAQVNPSTGQLDPAGWPQVLENQIKLNYKFTDNIFIGPVLNFYFFPGQTSNSIMQDSGIRLGSKSLYKNGGFKLAGDVRALAPVTPGDHRKNAAFLYEGILNATYAIPESKWTVGLLSFNKLHTYNNNAVGHLDAELYAAPNVNWQFSQKLAATMYVEFYPQHTIGEEGWGLYQPFDINPGINWDITDNFSLNPGLVFYPTSTLASTSAIMYISDKIF